MATNVLHPPAGPLGAAGTAPARVVAPALRIPEAAAAAVFAAVRQRGPVSREVVATLRDVSIATVNATGTISVI